MTLKECTKEELISIINILAHFDKSQLGRLLIDIEHKRAIKKLDEADNWAKIAAENRRRYAAIIEKYKGKPLITMPSNLMNEAVQCLKAADEADTKWRRLMDEVDSYGTT